VSDRVVVIYLGKVCEVGPPQELYELPHHPYTRLLLSSVPVADPDVPAKGKAVAGGREFPSAINPPSGCRFRTRCPRALARCAQEEPEVRQVGDGHYVACHFPVDGPMDLTSAPAPAPAVGT
jgi:peptide/nickel transport system ATP-binding protein